jgi:hypothetical protein
MSKEAIPGLPDFIAVSALAVLSDSKISASWTPARIATYCYDIADAILAEREARNYNKKEE